MPRISRVETFVYRVPITAHIKTSFGLITERTTLLVRIEDEEGASGWGEVWCNFPSVGAEYRARLVDTIVAAQLLGSDSSADPRNFWSRMDRKLHIVGVQTGEPGALAGALAGVDIALHDLVARRAGIPMWQHLGGTDGSPVRVYASGLNPGPEALQIMQASRKLGFRDFKIKVGFGEANDVATLEPVANALASNERIMVDANQGWDAQTACHMAGVLKRFPLAWIEEPLPADRPASEWAQVKAAAQAPLAGGENLRDSTNYHQVIADGYLSVIQPDLCKWGGLSGTLPVAQAVVASGRTFCPHFLAGGVGLLASLHLLAAVRGPGLAEVDANPNPLREDLLRDVLRVQNGTLAVPKAPGIGVGPDLVPFKQLCTLHTEARLASKANA